MYLSIRASTTETIARRGGSVVEFGVETTSGENRVPGATTNPHYRSGIISKALYATKQPTQQPSQQPSQVYIINRT